MRRARRRREVPPECLPRLSGARHARANPSRRPCFTLWSHVSPQVRFSSSFAFRLVYLELSCPTSKYMQINVMHRPEEAGGTTAAGLGSSMAMSGAASLPLAPAPSPFLGVSAPAPVLAYTVSIYDVPNRLIAGSFLFPPGIHVAHVLAEWGALLALTSDGKVCRLRLHLCLLKCIISEGEYLLDIYTTVLYFLCL